ncbi:ABC transporter permease [bacterium]|jgi:spermidine/putrescine transport system permease protein|nr:ABC transporter permease [bacterium]
MVERRSIFTKFIFPLFVALAYLFVYLPIAFLVIFSFNASDMPARFTGFSLKWYKALLHSPQILTALKASLIIAAATSILSVILGACLVIASKWWRPRSVLSLFYPNLVLPDIVIALGLMLMFTFMKVPLGYVSIIVGHTLLSLGFVVPIIHSRFKEIDPVLTEASLDLGANYSQTFKEVIIPLMTPSLLTSAFLSFILSLDDFLICFFCSGPTVETLPLYIYSRIRVAVDPSLNALTTCMLVITSFLVLLVAAGKIANQMNVRKKCPK